MAAAAGAEAQLDGCRRKQAQADSAGMQIYARAVLLSAAKRCRCMHVALIAACAPLTMAEECTSRKRNYFFFLSPPQKKKCRRKKGGFGQFCGTRKESDGGKASPLALFLSLSVVRRDIRVVESAREPCLH